MKEDVELAKKALALMLLVEPRPGESLKDFVERAEKKVAKLVESERESVNA